MNDEENRHDTQPLFPPPAGPPPAPTTPLAGPSGPPPAGPPAGHPAGPPAGPPSGPLGFTGEPARPARPKRAKFAAGVIAASLLVGGGAGIGGAAAWNAWDDEGGTGSSTTPVRTTSKVVDTPKVAAADGSVESVASSVLPSVVKIDVQGAQGAGSGSGIVLSSDGQILTNDHVVSLAGEGGQISVSFSDGTKAPATIVGTDPLTDTAVIQAEDVDGLTPATIGSSSDLAVGEGVVAIGSPFGLDATVTSGIVSALDRPVDVGSDGQGNTTAYPAIQTDAAINPGNSGGPLVDMNGHVVGINSSIRTSGSSGADEGGSIGLGFAIPIDAAMPIVEQLAAGEAPTHARLGITVSDSAEATDVTSEGALVRELGDGSAAAKAGLEAGDVITRINDRMISGADDLIAIVRSYRPGDSVTITFRRGAEEQNVDLTLDSDA